MVPRRATCLNLKRTPTHADLADSYPPCSAVSASTPLARSASYSPAGPRRISFSSSLIFAEASACLLLTEKKGLSGAFGAAAERW